VGRDDTANPKQTLADEKGLVETSRYEPGGKRDA
jgi:hypothetical protein